MKKIGLIILAMVLALGAAGIGYAAWNDTVVVEGEVSTAEVCLVLGGYKEVNDCDAASYVWPPTPSSPLTNLAADQFWTLWVPRNSPNLVSCPAGHQFADLNPDGSIDYLPPFGIYCDPELKAVAWVEVIGYDEDGNEVPKGKPAKEVKVFIHNAYPYFATELTMYLASCSTIPIRLCPEIILQDPWLLIQWGENLGGIQWHPNDFEEASLFIGVTQHQGYWDYSVPNGPVWIVDDVTKPPLPQGETLSFTIKFHAYQWNEYLDYECPPCESCPPEPG